MPCRADVEAEIADLRAQRPALVAAVRQADATALDALDALDAARSHLDDCAVRAREARRWADGQADRLRAWDRAIADAHADLARLPAA
jgi:multidrug efflux pump subunit AcrA (membrane-fusion protein)